MDGAGLWPGGPQETRSSDVGKQYRAASVSFGVESHLCPRIEFNSLTTMSTEIMIGRLSVRRDENGLKIAKDSLTKKIDQPGLHLTTDWTLTF